MAWATGELINSKARMRRLSGSIPTSYTIQKIDSTYYAECNVAGGNEYSGTDAKTVINSAITALTRGKIALKGTDFSISNTILTKKGVVLEGLGSDSPYPEVVTQPITRLVWTGAAGGTVFSTGSSEAWTGQLRNLVIDGDWTANLGLEVTTANGGYFENVFVTKCQQQAMLLRTLAGITGNSVNNTFVNCFFGPAQIGLELNGADASHPVTLNTFVGCKFGASATLANPISLRFNQYADTNHFYGCRVTAPSPGAGNGWGIVLGDANDVGVDQNIFNGVTVDGEGANAVGVLIRQNSEAHRFTDCVFGGTWGTKVSLSGNAKAMWKSCVGYVTENSGTSTGTGGEQTIAHGCNFTPTEDEVFLSERTTGGALARQSSAPDATNIYITATNAKDYNWKVEKK